MTNHNEMSVEQRVEYNHERKRLHDIDGRPKVTDATHYSEYDPLLEALYRVHAEPRRDLYPGTRG